MLKNIYHKLLKKVQPAKKINYEEDLSTNESKIPISKSLSKNLQVMKQLFANSADVVFRDFILGEEKISAFIVFIHGITNEDTINNFVLKSLLDMRNSTLLNTASNSPLEHIKNIFLEIGDIKELYNIGEVIKGVLAGDTILFVDGTNKALKINTNGFKSRSVGEPITERVVRGPRDGFTEVLRTNTALLRQRIKSHQLKFEKYVLGRTTQTEVNLAYLEDIVDKKVIKEVRERISRIDVDSILESGYIEELIEDEPFTLFPQIEHSERPDKVAAAILEGRLAIFTENTPFVLTVPSVFVQFLQSSEDYYERYPYSWAIRAVRYLFLLFALLLPATYVAVISYHQEFLPTSLLISISSAHEGVPFPSFVEALLMEITFEALREAGIRLPMPVGQAVSIVGALVIGQSAVQAGLVSPAMVIVVSLTAIASFAIPSYDMAYAIRVLRFGFIALGGFLGFYGIMLGLLALGLHLTSLRSFGVPYLSPIAPLRFKDLKDVIARFPWWSMGERPSFLEISNRRRQKFNLKPTHPKNK